MAGNRNSIPYTHFINIVLESQTNSKEMAQGTSDIAMIGLAVMGSNLARNLERNGYTVSVYNYEPEMVDRFMEEYGEGHRFSPHKDYKSLVDSLKTPRKIMMMIKAGSPVDMVIDQLLPFLDKGDIIIDGGNSNYKDTERRVKYLAKSGINFVGSGTSGGEVGALNGPSIMPGGSPEAKDDIVPILKKIAAKAPNGDPCCEWIGPDGAGHFVKMIHNGIEYGDMQLISEAYYMMKNVLGKSNEEMADIFEAWNKGPLDSYLVGITAEILRRHDPEAPDEYLIDKILDAAGQKGTGKWSVQTSLDFGIPLNLISTAVYERSLSSLKDLRMGASKAYGLKLIPETPKGDLVPMIEKALYASKLVSYAQGFQLIADAGEENGWDLDLGALARIWRAGCIIRSTFLDKIDEAYKRHPGLRNLLLDEYFKNEILEALDDWREVVAVAAKSGLALPAMSNALHYLYSLTSETLPANMIQAQRDYFGAHTFERIDRPRGTFFHEDWEHTGSDFTSNSYNA